jgi:hypothetical protein
MSLHVGWQQRGRGHSMTWGGGGGLTVYGNKGVKTLTDCGIVLGQETAKPARWHRWVLEAASNGLGLPESATSIVDSLDSTDMKANVAPTRRRAAIELARSMSIATGRNCWPRGCLWTLFWQPAG